MLRDNTLIAHVAPTTTHITSLFRSGGHGRTWKKVFEFASGYGTLTAHSIPDDGRYAYVASYNRRTSGINHTTWVWRSANDGRSWSRIHETAENAHAISFRRILTPETSMPAMAMRRCLDARTLGRSWPDLAGGMSRPPCRSVDIAVDPSGFAVWEEDQLTVIVRFDLKKHTRTQWTALPGRVLFSVSTFEAYLVGSVAREPALVPIQTSNCLRVTTGSELRRTIGLQR